MVSIFMASLELLYIVSTTRYVECVWTREHLFQLNNDMYLTIVKLSVELSDTNVSYCLMQCQALNGECNSILFNTDTRQCSLGSKIETTATARDTSTFLLYHARACNKTDGFEKFADDMTTACVWISTNSLSYVLAYRDCQYRKSHLFAPRDVNKFNLFDHVMFSYNTTLWVGLDDSEEEGVFRLADDGSILNPILYPAMFKTGQPDNGNNSEDFVFYYPGTRRFNDVNARTTARYVCEISIFV